MKVRVDMTKCEAYGNCVDEAPELFTLDEWGYSQVVGHGNVPGEQQQAARRAAAACPAQAITAGE